MTVVILLSLARGVNSRAAYDGSVQRARSSLDGIEGGCYYLDGGAYIAIKGLDISPKAFPRLTIGAWVRPEPTSAYKTSDPPR